MSLTLWWQTYDAGMVVIAGCRTTVSLESRRGQSDLFRAEQIVAAPVRSHGTIKIHSRLELVLKRLVVDVSPKLHKKYVWFNVLKYKEK